MDNKEKRPFLYCEATEEEFDLTDQFSIGRSKQSQLHIDNKRVSREHGIIHKKGDSYFYSDLNSSNGSKINSKRVNSGEAVELYHGSLIKLANRQFMFCIKQDSALIDRTIRTHGGNTVEQDQQDPESGGNYAMEKILLDLLNDIQGGDPVLIRSVKNGINSIAVKPQVAISQCRDIFDRAIQIIFENECPEGKIPEDWVNYWKEKEIGFKSDDILEGVIPYNVNHKLHLLMVMTGIKGVKPKAKFIDKETYFMMSHINSVSKPGNHPELGYFKTSEFAGGTLLFAVTLCRNLAEHLSETT
ncbi:FHA domain-containing protein [Verrucomicrobia bacterium]|nr:FHA domain-containing protein [Verrucomicrobiota bacterium]